LENLSAATTHLDFQSHGYHAHLGPTGSSDLPSEADLESHVPSLPTGWAVGGVEGVKRAAVASREAKAKRKTRHALPKGAVEGTTFTEDVSR
jgi:signal recognition particle subunit SRP72